MFSKKHPKVEMIVGAETVIKGEVTSKGTVRIDGRLEGDVTADCVIIGDTGSIIGDLTVKSLVAGGKLIGNVSSSECVEILPKGEICGDINTCKLCIAEGGQFDGRSFMQKSLNVEFKTVEVLQ